jgi:Ca2+-binding RTX toxin-like protein
MVLRFVLWLIAGCAVWTLGTASAAALQLRAATLGVFDHSSRIEIPDSAPPPPDECRDMIFNRVIVGTAERDVIVVSGSTNDLIFGLGGDDVIDGGAGDD